MKQTGTASKVEPQGRFRPTLRTEVLALIASLFFTLCCNGSFWSGLLGKNSWGSAATWVLVFATATTITGLQTFLLLFLLNRWTAKPLLIALALVTSVVVYYMATYHVYFNMEMMRNVFETDPKEATELISWRVAPYLLGLGLLPSLLVWRVQFLKTPWKKALLWRLSSMIVALLLSVGAFALAMGDLVPMMREHRELRYLITPSNYVISSIKALSTEKGHKAKVRTITAPTARRATSQEQRKPIAFILVVGETVRAANWGLNGYARQTTPELAQRSVFNFIDVSSCGTDTATSVPCMFSEVGRHNYDEAKIRSSQSFLHVLDRVGVPVLWRDNQSGCKGTCDGLAFEDLSIATDPELCSSGRCYDEILIKGLKEKIDMATGDTLIVLHMLGNHGPAYFERYPDAYRQWTPTCDTTDLSSCSQEALINTYDNAIGYTDHVLAQAIDLLSGISSHETGLLYVSDHGESLGEHNLYLHGLPYRIAPETQYKVPMVLWLSDQLEQSQHLDPDRLQARTQRPASHDVLFHTMLGLFGVEAPEYDASFDLLADSRTEQPSVEPDPIP